MRYLLHLAYKGTNYRGWQRQLVVKTVQQTLEDTLSKLVKYKVIVVGCGRTDAGVHASNYVAHMDMKEELRLDFLFIINKMLPDDITVYSTELVADNSQAQFHASRRRYDYYIHTKLDPSLHDVSTYYDVDQLDFTTMQSALTMLIGRPDCKNICRQPEINKHTYCEVSKAALYHDGYRLQVRIEANRFLRSMVRLVVGNVMAIGKGTLTLAEWQYILEGDTDTAHQNLAPPQGLYLSGIYYRDRVYDEASFLSLAE